MSTPPIVNPSKPAATLIGADIISRLLGAGVACLGLWLAAARVLGWL